MSDNDRYLLWLSSIKDFGLEKKFKLLDLYGSAYNIWCAPISSLCGIEGITQSNIEKIKMSKDEVVFKKYVDNLKNENIRFITINNKDYPKLLKFIDKPPYWLYIRGQFPVTPVYVSIVGSRDCSSYGSAVANRIATDLAVNNCTVVSGMAGGIDSQAHAGAILGGGKTIAVFPGGIDVCYPSYNKELMNRIIDNGCIISEFPLGTRPYPNNFRIRNRIISGLSHGVVVVESTLSSGTSITVNYALAQGREVFAVPGNINSINSAGTNKLLQDGAGLVCCASDILNSLNYWNFENDKRTVEDVLAISDDETKVLNCVSLEPLSVDGIVYKTNLSVSSVQFNLTNLLLKKLVVFSPGQGYVRSI